MSRKCDITGKGILTGNNVSYAHNKTRRRFLPNVQRMTVLSESLGPLRLKLAISTLRSIEKSGGFDQYLLSQPASGLAEQALKLRKQILRIKGKASA